MEIEKYIKELKEEFDSVVETRKIPKLDRNWDEVTLTEYKYPGGHWEVVKEWCFRKFVFSKIEKTMTKVFNQ